jgi:phage tail tape-measure protein
MRKSREEKFLNLVFMKKSFRAFLLSAFAFACVAFVAQSSISGNLGWWAAKELKASDAVATGVAEAVGYGVAEAGAWAGAKVGAAIGTAGGPVGAVVGGVIGAGVGAF